MLFSSTPLTDSQLRNVSPRLLAHIGDAVFHLYERERELLSAATVSDLHRTTSRRASAGAQAGLLNELSGKLTEVEADIVRRARNIKPQRQKRTDQAAYRKSTAFEALIGYLYLTDSVRLKQILEWTLPNEPKQPSDEG
jgi:ribonuclease-3 family protein